jgi:hypothetical protein
MSDPRWEVRMSTVCRSGETYSLPDEYVCTWVLWDLEKNLERCADGYEPRLVRGSSVAYVEALAISAARELVRLSERLEDVGRASYRVERF